MMPRCRCCPQSGEGIMKFYELLATLASLVTLTQTIPLSPLQPLYIWPIETSQIPESLSITLPTMEQWPTVVGKTTTSLTSSNSSSDLTKVSTSKPTETSGLVSKIENNSTRWKLPTNFTMDDLHISKWVWGLNETVEIVSALLPDSEYTSNILSDQKKIRKAVVGDVIEVTYPEGSINPANKDAPQGGMGFYASPLDLSLSTNVTLSYSVFFPEDFDFVKGGKLPGLYGGKTGCSGGSNSDNCFSTRMMFRSEGMGELYLYAPKKKQGPTVCETRPVSYCDAEYGYSIGRGAWNFTRGAWTKIRQDIWLNTDGKPNGGFNIWINDKLVINSNETYYRNAEGVEEIDEKKSKGKKKKKGKLEKHRKHDSDDENGSDDGSLIDNPKSPSGIEELTGVNPSGLIGNVLSLPIVSALTSLFKREIKKKFVERIQVNGDDQGNHNRNFGSFIPLGYENNQISPNITNLSKTNSLSKNLIIDLPSQNQTQINDSNKKQLKGPLSESLSNLIRGLITIRLKKQEEEKEIKTIKVKKTIAKFIGIMGDTFFGGHDSSWASKTDQFSYFRSFELIINN